MALHPTGLLTSSVVSHLRRDVLRYVSPLVDYRRVSSIGPHGVRFEAPLRHASRNYGGGYQGGGHGNY